jgi:predicted Rossmann fold nucleotide-binding protein DprA/Smf involved in DNA uptake
MYDYLIYNDEIANGPNRFAIVRRNRYIAENVDVILCYIKNKSGGAFNAVKYAMNRNIQIINLGLVL